MGLCSIEDLLALAPGPLRDRVRTTLDRVRGALDGETPGLGRDRPAFQEHDPAQLIIGSISNEHTFPADLSESTRVDGHLLALVERVCWRARQRGVRARTVTLKLRYADFHTVQRSRTCLPSCEEAEVLAAARTLLRRAWSRRAAIRLLGVALSNLVGCERQLRLPFDAIERPPRAPWTWCDGGSATLPFGTAEPTGDSGSALHVRADRRPRSQRRGSARCRRRRETARPE